MSIRTLEILEPGLMTTVQDRGRYGYQRFGVPVSGALDWFAMRAANTLVGNGSDAAGLEMTVLGPRVRFLAPTRIALAGADLAPSIDGEPVPMWEAVPVDMDSILSFQGARDGIRCYLAAAGGIDVPVVMGSRSTYVKGAIGGAGGRPLQAGDVVSTFPRESENDAPVHGLPEDQRPYYGHDHRVRVVLGPQDEAFTEEGMKTFLASQYAVAIQSDRIGYRLEGPAIEHRAGADIVSDGTPHGAVQVPGDGQPIVLLADRGTTGGYAKIATVISADIGKLAQAMPKDTLSFEAVTVEEAQSILREQVGMLDAIRRGTTEKTDGGKLGIVVDGEAYEVVDASGDAIALPDAAVQDGAGRKQSVRAVVDGEAYEFEIGVYQAE